MNTTTPATRALVVYESMFGNTEKLAEAVVRGLRRGGCDAVGLDVRWAELGAPVDADLLVLAAPTHAFSLSRPSTREDAVRRGAPPARAATGLREWLTSLQPARDGGPAVAIFDTRAEMVRRLPASAARSAARLARLRGFRVVDRPQGFVVDDVAGPLGDGELERAEAWGRSLVDLVAQREPGGSR